MYEGVGGLFPGVPAGPGAGRPPDARHRRAARLAAALLLLLARPLAAQVESHWTASLGGGVVALSTLAMPGMAGENLTEGYLTQPLVMATVQRAGKLRFSGMLNLEGLTLRRGELNAGIWGEGYVDRRHPHTFAHELVGSGWLMGSDGASRGLTVTMGRGFAPFGTDDPMARPMVKFPANHHLSHVLERYVAIAALRLGPAAAEAAAFNGNEPAGTADLSGLRRFGDSWSTRLTIYPGRGAELQGSVARVASPELPAGSESLHRKWSASARWERRDAGGSGLYGLLEWARTDELFSGVHANTLDSLLGEAAFQARGVEVAGRLERTKRPEEERLGDPFRTPNPHADIHLLGLTRWRILSARLSLPGSGAASFRAVPFVEVSRAAVEKVFPTQLFDPEAHFGSSRIWSLSLGARLEAGAVHGRMGRYGAAAGPGGGDHHH